MKRKEIQGAVRNAVRNKEIWSDGYGKQPGRGINNYLKSRLRDYYTVNLQKTISPFVQSLKEQSLIQKGKGKWFNDPAYITQRFWAKFIIYVDGLVEQEKQS
jgi:hypothetical protein